MQAPPSVVETLVLPETKPPAGIHLTPSDLPDNTRHRWSDHDAQNAPRVMTCEYCPRPEFDIQPASPTEIRFRHSSWERHRWLTYEALKRQNPYSASLYRFIHCGSGSIVQVSPDGKQARAVSNTCKNRLCVPCRRKAARIIQGNLIEHISHRLKVDRACRVRSITLTLKHSDRPLKEQLKRLGKCFARLRKDRAVSQIFKGGASVVEVKKSHRDGHWHPHLHIIAEGRYAAFTDLSNAWKRITGDSHVVHVQAIQDHVQEVQHHCKYITKAADCSVYQDTATLDEYIVAIHGARTVTTFGNWRGVKLSKAPKSDIAWKSLCSLETLLRRAAHADPDAVAILRLLDTDHPNGARDTTEDFY